MASVEEMESYKCLGNCAISKEMRNFVWQMLYKVITTAWLIFRHLFWPTELFLGDKNKDFFFFLSNENNLKFEFPTI